MTREEPDPLNPDGLERSPLLRHANPPEPFRAPLDGAECYDAITDHIERHVGPAPMCLHEMVSDKVHLDVIPVLPTDEQPFHTFVTSGMSDEPMTAVPKGAEELQYAELLVRLPKDWPVPVDRDMSPWKDPKNYWPIRLLKSLARFPHEYHTWISFGHTIETGPLDGSGGFAGALILTPLTLPDAFHQLRVSDSKKIHFFLIVPLHPDEMEFKRTHGLDALLDLLPDPEITEIIDPHRPSCIPPATSISSPA